ncbi:hypothetical protein RKE38_00780 [Phycicoccus sp. M110.8]|uniref:hypothetical protein n=1 Tax=Phycicoccus sp. M110.8 TaxID=3075433 RepID=UPI0028FDB107|nr:hypothetical protein [Phycicoccus sp. M110.8]MDU0312201.1 hypothetical protein [Phycicoccus sp. M110.8]HET8768547.1 hypothetical protein [Pedococcus sp.]
MDTTVERLRHAALLLVASSAVTVVLLGVAGTTGSVPQAVLVAGLGTALLALTAVARVHVPVPALAAVRRPTDGSRPVSATPSWLHVDVPRRPRRPRAPGSR